MAATRVRLSPLEQQILDRIFLSPEGFEAVEDLCEVLGAEQSDLVDALESLEGNGYLAISNLGGTIVVSFEDAEARFFGIRKAPETSHMRRVVNC